MEALKTKEPGWKPIAYIDFPHSRCQVKGAFSVNPKSRSEDVNVSVYSVESHGEAAPWLGGVRNWRVAAGWQVSTYRIGDEGYLFRHPFSENEISGQR
jgi:hypothetical protein